MKPSKVRQVILSQHDEIRKLLGCLDEFARRAAEGDAGCAPALREIGLQAYSKLVEHLDLEDEYLVPAIRDADAWGEERAERLGREHAEQRELLRYILERLRENQSSVLLGRELQDLVEVIFADMDQEEERVLDADLLRDDVVGIDVETG